MFRPQRAAESRRPQHKILSGRCKTAGLGLTKSLPPTHGRALLVVVGGGLPRQQTASASMEGFAMSDHVYKVVELVGSSPSSIEDAITGAIERASKTIRNIRWFEVIETRGHVEDGKVHHFQVKLKVGFTLDPA